MSDQQNNNLVIATGKRLFCAACPVDTGTCPWCGTFWVRNEEVRTGYRAEDRRDA
jgi:hypothetical protein